MKTLWVKRTDSSSYFPADFSELERQALEAVEGIRYLPLEANIPQDVPLCLLTNTHTRLDKWLSFRPQVELVLHPNSGMDNLAPHLVDWKMPVVLGNPIRAQAVAEWVLGCLFQHFAPIVHHSVWPLGRQWDRPRLQDQKVLLIGHGHVGQLVNHFLQGLGVQVVVQDPHHGQGTDLHRAWDVVILLASCNPGSERMLDEKFFAHAATNLLLINPARAELIDESAIRVFLKRNPQARAYLDVHQREPYPARYWDDCPQVVATPHVAGVWQGLIPAMLAFEAQTLRSWLQLDPSTFKTQHADLMAHSRMTDKGWYR